MRGQGTSPLQRGLQAEESFKKLLGEAITSSALSDRFDHVDFLVRYDVKRIRSVDEFGESNYHWLELVNVNGNTGWLYGKSDYFAFETKRYWIVVAKIDLHEFINNMVTDTTVTYEKRPYGVYRRKDRLDKVVMVPTVDLCAIGFMIEKK